MKRDFARKTMRGSAPRKSLGAALYCFPALALCACSGAPTIDVDGSFLPAWMLCVLAGLAATFLIHWQVTQRRLQERIRPAVVFYPSMAVGIACLLWLLLFR